MIKVASYCRVSTDKDDQANSFEAQQRYFKEYIERHSDWELYEVYADEGITGTSTKKRAQFNRMINDAYLGRFNLIITKEVSRFSRNILDTISYTRELKSMGISVIFMNDGINTLDADAELRLSIMASIAQEESRKTSSRVKWGQTRQMERGVVFGRSLLGYDVKDGKLTINPEGAELVRRIFHKYGIEKKGTSTIARELREAGYRTYSGNAKWSNSHIIKILKNEKYVGDLVQKKTYTPDYLTHEKKANRGAEEMVTIENHHEPIIDRELWDTVQAELVKRNRHGELGEGHSNRYVFSGKIKCGECGASFVSRSRKRKDGTTLKRWSCYTAVNEGRKHTDAHGNEVGCDVGHILRDDVAMDMLKQALASLRFDKREVINNVTALAIEAILADTTESKDDPERLYAEIERVEKKKEGVLDAFFSGDITRDEMLIMKTRYDEQVNDLNGQLKELDVTRSECNNEKQRGSIQQELTSLLNRQSISEVFYKIILDRITVFRNRHSNLKLKELSHMFQFDLKRKDYK